MKESEAQLHASNNPNLEEEALFSPHTFMIEEGQDTKRIAKFSFAKTLVLSDPIRSTP